MTAFPKHTSAPSRPQARGETVLHDRRITVDGVKTQYLEAGAGPPLLLLHGHEQSATSWRWVIPALARTHRVLALSLPGHGESAPAADGHAPGADLAPFVAAFLFAVVHVPGSWNSRLNAGWKEITRHENWWRFL